MNCNSVIGIIVIILCVWQARTQLSLIHGPENKVRYSLGMRLDTVRTMKKI